MTQRSSIGALQTEPVRHPESLPIDLTDHTARKKSGDIYTQAGGKERSK